VKGIGYVGWKQELKREGILTRKHKLRIEVIYWDSMAEKLV